MEFKILSTDSGNADFHKLIRLLDEDLGNRYGEVQKEYARYNKVDFLADVVVIYLNDSPVACGAFKGFDTETVELKRIFVQPEARGQGLGKLLVQELETKARSKGYSHAVLETGLKQLEAIGLYKKCGYHVIANYEPYVGMENSVCMKKAL